MWEGDILGKPIKMKTDRYMSVMFDLINFNNLEQETYQSWFKKIQWLKDKVILPNNITISKSDYVTDKGFEIDGFNSLLFQEYNKQYPVK